MEGVPSSKKIPLLSCNLGQACYTCFKEPRGPSDRLSYCSGCKRVAYCGAACQKADWKKHKTICRAFCELEKRGPSASVQVFERATQLAPPDQGRVNILGDRCQHEDKATLESLVGRSLSIPERNLVGWEPKCITCGRTDRRIRTLNKQRKQNGEPELSFLQSCPNCNTTFFCSPEHEKLAETPHRHEVTPTALGELTQCQVNQIIRQDVALKSIFVGAPDNIFNWAPERSRERWESFRDRTWEQEFLSEVTKSFSGTPLPSELFLRAVSEKLTLPMTILYALDILNGSDTAWTQKSKLTIHILGAAQVEVTAAMVFEEILHRLPALRELELVLYGRDIDKIFMSKPGEVSRRMLMDTCLDCTRRGRRRIHDHIAKPYHIDVGVKGDSFKKPDLAVAFNSGIFQQEAELWEPTLQTLIKSRIPSVFTAYNEEEAHEDAEILRRVGAHAVEGLGPAMNPWGSMSLITEPGKVSGFYAINGWLAGGFC